MSRDRKSNICQPNEESKKRRQFYKRSILDKRWRKWIKVARDACIDADAFMYTVDVITERVNGMSITHCMGNGQKRYGSNAYIAQHMQLIKWPCHRSSSFLFCPAMVSIARSKPMRMSWDKISLSNGYLTRSPPSDGTTRNVRRLIRKLCISGRAV